MAVQVSWRNACLLVRLPAEMASAEAERVRRQLGDVTREHLGPGSRERAAAVVVDWTEAPYLTCTGIAVLEEVRHRIAAYGVPVYLAASRALPRKALQLMGLNGRLPLFHSVDEAFDEALDRLGGTRSGEARSGGSRAGSTASYAL
ncbi:STAS domain-containing protein [Streptomyces sp. ODS28]|uniref:STAS domain-containing protein n=1 Tax=Streptomyces sp. ODS28 TaxID=3136688 RepID=UPI0031E7294D